MKFKSLAIPALSMVGVAIFGVVLAALFADGSLFATTPPPEPPLAESSDNEPTTRDILLPNPSQKLQPVTVLQSPGSPPQPSTKSTRPEPEPLDEGKVYTWDDGDRTLRVVLQTDLAIQNNVAIKSTDTVVSKGVQESIVELQNTDDQSSLPVFRSVTGGGLMTLPGGVLLALDPDWDSASIDSFFAANNISPKQVMALDFVENGFFIETEPGFPSLALANTLAAQNGVLISSPNWQAERELK